MERLRLSEASQRVTAALATFDGAALTRLAESLHEIQEGRAAIDPEPAAAVHAAQRILEDLLAATGQNMDFLRRLRERNTRNEWAI